MNELLKLSGPVVKSSTKIKFLVIFLHGWGSDGNDLIQLADYWKKDLKEATFLSPHGPDECSANPSGRQWFEINQGTNPNMIEQIFRSYKLLEDYINYNLKENNLSANNYFLVGFSQGTMLSIFYALRKKCLGVIGYSGAFIEGSAEERTEKNDFLLIHGKNDVIVPLNKLHEAEKSLTNLSNNVETIEYQNLEHSINEDGLIKGLDFIKKRI